MNDLLLYWFLFISISALIGAFIGTLLALGASALIKKIKNRSRYND